MMELTMATDETDTVQSHDEPADKAALAVRWT